MVLSQPCRHRGSLRRWQLVRDEEEHYHSIDRDLGYRIKAVIPFIQSHPLNTRKQFERSFAKSSDSSVVGVFVQITDDQRQILYQSDVLQAHRVPALPACLQDEPLAFTTIGEHGWPVRVATQCVTIEGIKLAVHVVEPLRDMLEALHEYSFYLAFLIPAALFLPPQLAIGSVGKPWLPSSKLEGKLKPSIPLT